MKELSPGARIVAAFEALERTAAETQREAPAFIARLAAAFDSFDAAVFEAHCRQALAFTKGSDRVQ
jgi:hypothetical protein